MDCRYCEQVFDKQNSVCRSCILFGSEKEYFRLSEVKK